MKVIKEISAVQDISDYFKCIGKKTGLVPTMGFLHEGHASLIIKAKEENDIVFVSIFVNPTQFGKNEDFGKYPRDFERDYHICEKAGADYIFYPDIKEMYGENSLTSVTVSGITERLEGEIRPGHFTGVATVVLKLLNAVKPDNLYLGQKDAQQNAVVGKMISDLNVDVNLKICATMREANGLAMSSRNTYLTEEQRTKASVLYFLLEKAKKMILEENISDVSEIKEIISDTFKQMTPEFELQYFDIAENKMLTPLSDLESFEGEILISLAAKVGSTRLIDNVILRKIRDRK
ncbi:MAG: pantoate--beta-alanine ligase [Bacteroidetes bacterium]|nr:pantoate--beta-alanine ligase [Bacteroidota bacterium]